MRIALWLLALFGIAVAAAVALRVDGSAPLPDPRSPWQKGAVKNANGRLRRYLPSDAPAERLAGGSLEALAGRLNATPRRCLGYRTPAEVFNGYPGANPAEAGPAVAVSH